MSRPPASTREAPAEGRGIFTADLPHDALVFLARRGLAEAQFRLGAAYLTGDQGVRCDSSEATRWFQRAAEQDHVEAQVHLAEAYYHGVGVGRDREEAAYWFRAAADLGHEHARLRLGMMYADAEAQLYIDPEARERLETAALAGYWPARHLLHAWRTEDKEAEETVDPFRHQRARDMAGHNDCWWQPDPNPQPPSPVRRWTFRGLKAL